MVLVTDERVSRKVALVVGMAVEMVEDEGEWQKKQMDLFTCVFI